VVIICKYFSVNFHEKTQSEYNQKSEEIPHFSKQTFTLLETILLTFCSALYLSSLSEIPERVWGRRRQWRLRWKGRKAPN
jgi:hypothetical protein